MLVGISYQLGYGMLSFLAAFQNEFDRPVAQLTRSNTDTSRVGTADDFSFRGGVRFAMDPSTLFSDRRLKTNIAQIGSLPSGLPVYRYNYIWSEQTQIGVMAQEAQVLFPNAVQEVDGYLAVDYSRIR